MMYKNCKREFCGEKRSLFSKILIFTNNNIVKSIQIYKYLQLYMYIRSFEQSVTDEATEVKRFSTLIFHLNP